MTRICIFDPIPPQRNVLDAHIEILTYSSGIILRRAEPEFTKSEFKTESGYDVIPPFMIVGWALLYMDDVTTILLYVLQLILYETIQYCVVPDVFLNHVFSTCPITLTVPAPVKIQKCIF